MIAWLVLYRDRLGLLLLSAGMVSAWLLAVLR